MNLWLSPHGIWYYRKVTTLPCGRRKEIKKSLHTRDKLCARHKVTQLFACVRSKAKPVVQPTSEPENPQPQPNIKPAVPAAKPLAPLLSVSCDRYQKEKALSWAPKERKNQKNYLGSFIEALGDKPAADYSKADVVKFKEGLLNSGKSPATINKYLQKLSLLFSWLTIRRGSSTTSLGSSYSGSKRPRPEVVTRWRRGRGSSNGRKGRSPIAAG
ncbi:phage integrase N-terminal SAM-like domain-containing protein [Aeromonas sobria]|uniref:phage integrase N-terminal SAM-like domain-containing protein n=1 Tax=Aeromonas sobria TaxID=646 RepID=UPI000AEAE811|nr:phage integrase N-terminal SAM-like domain-containing protein [Aeromonas sobria]